MRNMVEAKVEHAFTASAERVFDAWLDPDAVRIWMLASLKSMGLPGPVCRVEIDARVGGKFTFSDSRDSGEAIHWGYYRKIERPHRLVFTWFTTAEDEQADASLVTLTIKPTATGCLATITHNIHADYADYIPQTERGWGAMLAQSGTNGM